MTVDAHNTAAVTGNTAKASTEGRGGCMDRMTWSTTPFTSEPIKWALPLQILNILSFIAMVAINIICWALRVDDYDDYDPSTGLPFDYYGRNNFKSVSYNYAVLISPRSYGYLVWIPIYILGAIFCIYQAFPAQRHNPNLFSAKGLFVWFFLANIFNLIWNLVYTFDHLWAAWAMILCMLICLCIGYSAVRVGRKLGQEVSTQEYVALHFMLSTYLSWVSFLFAVNFAMAIRWASGWRGDIEGSWPIFVLVLLFLVALVLLATRRDWSFGLIMGWAFLANFALLRKWHEEAEDMDNGVPKMCEDCLEDFPPQNEYAYRPNMDRNRDVYLTAVILGSILLFLSTFVVPWIKLFLWNRERRLYLENAPKVAVVQP